MIDINKQIAHWKNGAAEDWQVALDLADLERTRHSLFFVHLALEKTLKAHICLATNDLAPRVHSLLRLAEMTNLEFSKEQITFLARFDRYQIEGRYPDVLPTAPEPEIARKELSEAGELLTWMNNRF